MSSASQHNVEPNPRPVLRIYTVEYNGRTTQMRLNTTDARRLGATPLADAPTPNANDQPTETKQRTPRNKARQPATQHP